MAFLLSHAVDRDLTEDEKALLDAAAAAEQKFDAAMDDDLNTADAIGAIFDIVRAANTSLSADSAKAAVSGMLSAMEKLCSVLGLVVRPYAETVPEEIQALSDARKQARKDKNWAESDRLRDEMKSLGWSVEDTPQGQKIKRI